MWYRYNRRGPRGMRYFWFLFIPLFLFAGHGGLGGIFLWIAAIIILNLIGRAVFSAISSGSNKPYQSYQQGYQQPYYQPRSDVNQAAEQQYQAPQQQQYDQYEQPQAEYPQEMPPMQQ